MMNLHYLFYLNGLADDDAEKAVQNEGEPTSEARDRSADNKAGESLDA